ncbi:hypothetical protein NDU88_001041 [Pleurodeles waltl]|uniref:Uncharacterized protein n=1 Tax=Pleurodeles waltl TaxID=8319 RepID=A0AAV7ND38_PLEWA|nr:hypothetical protein NDU88_001041 [Pleurodeles waltl]
MPSLTEWIECPSDKHAERLDHVENSVSTVEDGQTELASSHTKCNKDVSALRLKVDDMEARSRRNNLRIVGIAESTAINNMESYIENLLVQLLGRNTFSELFVIERPGRPRESPPPYYSTAIELQELGCCTTQG